MGYFDPGRGCDHLPRPAPGGRGLPLNGEAAGQVKGEGSPWVAGARVAAGNGERAAGKVRRTECGGHPGKRGFTLLEMMIVLLIIAILASVTMPAFDSAVNEHRVREDGHQLALMVRTAMIQCAEQHRPYVIDLTKSSMALHPQGEAAKAAVDPDATLFQDSGGTNSDQPIEESAAQDVEEEQQMDEANKLQIPDPSKTNGWMDMTADGLEWVFKPGELCPATTIRVARGDAYLEMSFEALTGNIQNERSYFP